MPQKKQNFKKPSFIYPLADIGYSSLRFISLLLIPDMRFWRSTSPDWLRWTWQDTVSRRVSWWLARVFADRVTWPAEFCVRCVDAATVGSDGDPVWRGGEEHADQNSPPRRPQFVFRRPPSHLVGTGRTHRRLVRRKRSGVLGSD